MSNSNSLSNYFASEDKSKDFDLMDTSTRINNLKLEDNLVEVADTMPKSGLNEPEVCRLFAENRTEVVSSSKDAAASFFDLIGNSSVASTSSNGLISDLGISTNTEDNYSPRVTVGSEADRRRDAWLPSERTRKVLINCATAPPGTFFVEREMLTMPGVLLEEELGDSVGEAVSACLGEQEAAQRRAICAGDVTQDERGLRELVQQGAFRAAINLTARLLSIYGQGRGRAGFQTKHSPHSLQLWFTRIALLVKTKAFNIAQTEAEPFGQLDKPDVFYQFYPEMYGGRIGSIASFSFRLLLAELPMHCGKPKEALTKLFNLLAVIRQMLTHLKDGVREDGNPLELSSSDRKDSSKLWLGREARVMHSVINCALALKDYELAMDILGQLIERDGAPKYTLLSALGRLHLQLGDIAGAQVCFNEARDFRTGPTSVRDLVDQGLMAVAQNAFEDAFDFFQQASQTEPTNVMVLNNMGVCLLYGGRLKEAIAVLESAITANPVHALHESLLLNLCTLYDMESSRGRMKKWALLRQISRYQADAPTTILEKLYG